MPNNILQFSQMIENPECGSCTACCSLLAVPELGKNEYTHCTHCALGSGCHVYHTRPQSCRDFECLWRQGMWDGMAELRPDVLGVFVYSLERERIKQDRTQEILVLVETRPFAHKEVSVQRLRAELRLAGVRTIFRKYPAETLQSL